MSRHNKADVLIRLFQKRCVNLLWEEEGRLGLTTAQSWRGVQPQTGTRVVVRSQDMSHRPTQSQTHRLAEIKKLI